DVVTPNRGELAVCAMAIPGGRVPSADVDRARRLLDHGVATAVVVTLGREGALIVEIGRADPVAVPALDAVAVDTTGAGDAFAGALATALAEARPLEEAVRRAVVAAGLEKELERPKDGRPPDAGLLTTRRVEEL